MAKICLRYLFIYYFAWGINFEVISSKLNRGSTTPSPGSEHYAYNMLMGKLYRSTIFSLLNKGSCEGRSRYFLLFYWGNGYKRLLHKMSKNRQNDLKSRIDILAKNPQFSPPKFCWTLFLSCFFVSRTRLKGINNAHCKPQIIWAKWMYLASKELSGGSVSPILTWR